MIITINDRIKVNGQNYQGAQHGERVNMPTLEQRNKLKQELKTF